jgi:hypothetical protein
VRLIISNFPTTGAPTYRALRTFAGKSPVQVLTLTKMEVWSVPRNRVGAVKRAASRFGVGVDEFAPDWNHVLRPVLPNIGDDGKAERVQANTLRAPSDMSMALPPRAAMLEYALTKGSPDRPAKIVVRLNETTVLTLTRTSVEVGADLCTWHGTVDGTDAPATIMWWPGVASCNGCPRLPIWSNPNVFVKGDRAGSLNEDNARVIAEQAARITYFRASRRSHLLSSAPAPDTGKAGVADR